MSQEVLTSGSGGGGLSENLTDVWTVKSDGMITVTRAVGTKEEKPSRRQRWPGQRGDDQSSGLEWGGDI